ncbi:MAG: hypothetical protein JWP60_2107 [Ramlibacter sp.]|nr:hypothetical protein [Ramlibacter sp.]
MRIPCPDGSISREARDGSPGRREQVSASGQQPPGLGRHSLRGDPEALIERLGRPRRAEPAHADEAACLAEIPVPAETHGCFDRHAHRIAAENGGAIRSILLMSAQATMRSGRTSVRRSLISADTMMPPGASPRSWARAACTPGARRASLRVPDQVRQRHLTGTGRSTSSLWQQERRLWPESRLEPKAAVARAGPRRSVITGGSCRRARASPRASRCAWRAFLASSLSALATTRRSGSQRSAWRRTLAPAAAHRAQLANLPG